MEIGQIATVYRGSLNGTPFWENQQMHSDFEAFPGKESVKSGLFAITT